MTNENDALQSGSKQPHRWKPGESGNPSGKAIGTVSLTSAIKAKFREEGTQALLEAIDRLIADGNVAMLTEIWNRLDGKVSDKLEMHGVMLVSTPDQLDYAFGQLIEEERKVRLLSQEPPESTTKALPSESSR